MQIPQSKNFLLGATPMAELREFPKEARYATTLGTDSKLTRAPVGERTIRPFQFLATVYAVAMLAITVGYYTRSEEHPGVGLFFVTCLASFFIICYNALSIEALFHTRLERHYPVFRQLSIALAVVLATAPMAIFYLRQARRVVTPAAVSAPIAAPTAPAAVAAGSKRVGMVRDIRYLSGPNSTTVAIELDEKVQYEIKRLTAPERIYLDLRGSKLDPRLAGKKFPIRDSLLRAIRLAEHEGNVTRVTLETRRFSEYSVIPVPNSHRLLIELREATGQS